MFQPHRKLNLLNQKRPFSCTALILLLAFLIVPACLRGQWQQCNGPTGAHVFSLAVSDSFLIVGTDGAGVYISTSGGADWQSANNGLSLPSVISLAVASNGTGGKLWFAGTYGGGIFRSSDNGANWSAVNTGLGNGIVRAIAVFSDTSGMPVLFAGTMGGGAYRSVNNGASWINTSTGLGSNVVSSFAVNDTFILAGTDNGVYRMAKGGTSWTSAGLSGINLSAMGSIPDGAGGTVWFAGAFFLGTYRSVNNGNSWVAFNAGMTFTNPTCFASIDTNLYCGVYTGVLRTGPSAAGWTSLSTTFNSRALALVDNGPGALSVFVGNDDARGVFSTDDDGATWLQVNKGLVNTHVLDVTALPANSSGISPLFAAVIGEGGGIQRSDNQGDTWTNTGLTPYDMWSVNPIPDGNGAMNLLAGGDIGTYLSSDSGKTWNLKFNSAVMDAEAMPDGSGGFILYAGSVGGVYVSLNYGSSWAPINNGLTNTNVRSLAILGSTLIAATNLGVFQYDDVLSQWTAINNGLPNLNLYAVVAVGNDLFVAISTNGVYRSSNQGALWTPANTGMGSVDIRCFAVSGSTLIAGTFDAGVFVTHNLGTTWTPVNAGLGALTVKSLWIADSMLYAGTASQGVWKHPQTAQITSNGHELSQTVGSSLHLVCITDPFDPEIVLAFDLPELETVRLEVFDLHGRPVALLAHGQMAAGHHHVSWNTHGFASGLYVGKVLAKAMSASCLVTVTHR